MIELTIKIKDESQTLRVKYYLHAPISMDLEDPTLSGFIKESIEAFQGTKPPESVTVTAKMEV